MFSTLLLYSQQTQIQCQKLYKILDNQYQVCQKVGKLYNTFIDIDGQFQLSDQNNTITSIFQYGELLNHVRVNVNLNGNVSKFSVFAAITTYQINDCQFNGVFEQTKLDFYGLSQSISIPNSQIINSVINFTAQHIYKEGYSLAKNMFVNVNMQYYKDLSSFNGTDSDSNVSMTKEIRGDFKVEQSTFKQVFYAQKSAALFTLLANASGKNNIDFQVMNSSFGAIVSSNLVSNYGFIKQEEGNVYKNFDNIDGYVSGAYLSLTEDMSADQVMEYETLNVQLIQDQPILLDKDVDFNNTKISFGTSNNISANNQNVSIFGERSLYYGIHLTASKLTLTDVDTFTILTQNITKQVLIQNLILNMTLNTTASKTAYLALRCTTQISVENCTMAGSVNTTGAVYLLFETTSREITITDLTTSADLSFAEDSYGLIKSVSGGITVNGLNSNLSMSIIGDTLVESGLMFYNVITRQGTINNLYGCYGGYITNFTCTSSTCQLNIKDVNVSLDTRSVSGITYEAQTNQQYNGTSFQVYYPKNYLGKLNGTKVNFVSGYQINESNSSYATKYNLMLNLLGDSKIVMNTEVTADIKTNCTQQLYAGGIAGMSAQTGYTINNVKIAFTLSSISNASGYASDFFGVLNTSVTFNNVTSAGDLIGSLTMGGIIGYLETSSVTMKDVTIQGSYQAGSSECGGVIGSISSGSSTSVTNLTLSNAKISSMAQGSGPVYGNNQGTISNLQIISMNLNDRSSYEDCPIGFGTKYSYNQCPPPSESKSFTVTGYPYTKTFDSNSYHMAMTVHHAFEDSRDLNNSVLYLTLSGLTSVAENRSLFGQKVSYTNLQLIVENDPEIKWSSDSYCYSLVQAIMDDVTTTVSNIFIQSSVNGQNYAHFGALTSCFASNASVSNVTTNISKMYFYYASAFVEYINATSSVFSNIKVNATSFYGGTITGFFEIVHNKSTQLLLENSEIIARANNSNFKGGLAYQLYSGTGDTTFNNVSIQLTGETQSSTIRTIQCFYTANSSNLYFDNCTFNIKTNLSSSSGSGIFSSCYTQNDVNFTNCNFTGFIGIATSSTYSVSYDIATIEGYVAYGRRNVTNCKVTNQKVVGYRTIGGLFGYISGSSTNRILIEGTTVEAELQFNITQSTQYAGGFIAYKQYSSSSVTVENSTFNNLNGIEASCDTMLKGYEYTSTSNIKCLPEIKNVSITSSPTYTSSYYSSRGYDYINSACYWQTISDSQDWNFTTFNVSESAYGSQCGYSYHSLLTLFNPSTSPSQIKNVTLTGTVSCYSYYKLQIALVERNNQERETVYQNIKIQNEFSQVYKSGSEYFNTTGIAYMLSGTNDVKFVNCQSAYTITRTTSQYSSTTSSSTGFYYNNTISGTAYARLQNCESDLTLTQNTYSNGTELYSIAFILGRCTNTGFSTTGTLQQC